MSLMTVYVALETWISGSPLMTVYLSGSAWILASSSLIWGPNFCLQSFCCRFLLSLFSPPRSLSSHHPLLSLFLPPGLLSLSPSVSILLICSPLLWKVTSGERPPQLHTVLEWRRRHTWQAAECNPEKYLSSKEITWSLLFEGTAGGPCRAQKPFTTWNSNRLWSCKAWCFCVQARIFIWNMDSLFNHLGQKWLQKMQIQWLPSKRCNYNNCIILNISMSHHIDSFVKYTVNQPEDTDIWTLYAFIHFFFSVTK